MSANKMSFNDFKRDSTSLDNLDDRLFYRFSFDNRLSAELELQILEAIMKSRKSSEDQKTLARAHLSKLRAFLLKDATLAGNTKEAKKYMPVGSAQPSTAYQKLENDWNDLLASPWHVTHLITWISFINLYRLIGTFSRLSWATLWAYAAEAHILDEHNAFMGHAIDRNILDRHTYVFNFLSVALFASRLTLHLSMIAKHAIFRTDAEEAIERWELALREFYTRMPHILNDLVWMIMNLLTNYPQLWAISSMFANVLILVTLGFDLSWLIGQWYFKEAEINQKMQELEAFASPSGALGKDVTLPFLQDMLLEVRAKYLFQVFACLLIISSYASVVFLASSALIPAGFLACVMGFGMYGSCDEFAAYVRAKWGNDRSSIEDINAAWSTFAITASKMAFMPLLIVGVFTISAPAAVALTLLYVAYDRYAPSQNVQEVDTEHSTRRLCCFG